MLLIHLATRVSPYANEVLGYVSVGEGFVFLSALLAGFLYRRRAAQETHSAAERRLRGRAWYIYCFHAGLLAIGFAVGFGGALLLGNVALHDWMDYLLAAPRVAIPAAAILAYEPPLFDILPVFIIFLLLSPLMLRFAMSFSWSALVASSGWIWLLAQFHLRRALYGMAVAYFGLKIPLDEMGSFNLFAWQFLWVLGLTAGWQMNRLRIDGRALSVSVLTPVCLLAAALFLCRHCGAAHYLGPAGAGILRALVSKWRLGPLRLLDCAVIFVLVVRFGPALARNPHSRPLGLLGRNSIEVFSAHVLIVLAVVATATGSKPHFSPWADVGIVVLSVGTLFLVAYCAERRRSRLRSSQR